MDLNIEHIALLLLVASLVSMIARRLRFPYTVGLVLTGIGMAFLPWSLPIHLTKDLIFKIFLPPLIFEAAIQIPWQPLRRDLPVSVALATAGVLISAAVVVAGLYYGLAWPLPVAMLFGVLISATDPVAVIAMFREMGAQGRIGLLVETESLLNDGTAAVLFTLLLAVMIDGGVFDPLQTALSFIWVVGGGIICGLLVGGGVLLLVGKTEDHLLEITFTTIAAYGSFLLAEHFHLSGVLATMTTGMMMGNLGVLGVLTDKGRQAVQAFWEYAGFAVNSLVFLLMGMQMAKLDFTGLWQPLLIVITLVLIGRAAAIYGISALFRPFAPWRLSWPQQHVLFWGGLRGALALALVLGLPADIPMHDMLIMMTFGVVAFSIIVQGLSMPMLLRRLKVTD